jgi:hypothetical protein
MTPTFWRTVDSLGTAGVAALAWRLRLGAEYSVTHAFLRRSPRRAELVPDPDDPRRWLHVYPDSAHGQVATSDESPPHREPLPLKAEDLCELAVDVNRLRPQLANALAFVAATEATTAARDVHQLGIAQPTKGRAVPVLIYLPCGLPTDRAHFLRALSELPPSVLYVPTHRWQTPDAFKLAANRGIAIESLADRLAETLPVAATLSAPDEPGSSAARTKLRPLLRVQTGWRWEDVRIRLTIRATMIASHGTERGEHRFASAEKGESIRHFPRLFKMLIEISFAGHWQNPSPTTRDYEKVSKSFQRLRQTIEKLIPIPSEAFVRDGNRWRPRFQIQLDEEMETVTRRYRSMKNSSDHADDEETE